MTTELRGRKGDPMYEYLDRAHAVCGTSSTTGTIDILKPEPKDADPVQRDDLCMLCGDPVEGWMPELGDAPCHTQCMAELTL